MKRPEYEYQGAFLDEWVDRYDRGKVVNYFLHPIEIGARRPDLIIKDVKRFINGLLANPDIPERRQKRIEKLIDQIDSDVDECMRFVAFLIEREGWPEEKKARLRRERTLFYGDRIARV